MLPNAGCSWSVGDVITRQAAHPIRNSEFENPARPGGGGGGGAGVPGTLGRGGLRNTGYGLRIADSPVHQGTGWARMAGVPGTPFLRTPIAGSSPGVDAGQMCTGHLRGARWEKGRVGWHLGQRLQPAPASSGSNRGRRPAAAIRDGNQRQEIARATAEATWRCPLLRSRSVAPAPRLLPLSLFADANRCCGERCHDPLRVIPGCGSSIRSSMSRAWRVAPRPLTSSTGSTSEWA